MSGNAAELIGDRLCQCLSPQLSSLCLRRATSNEYGVPGTHVREKRCSQRQPQGFQVYVKGWERKKGDVPEFS